MNKKNIKKNLLNVMMVVGGILFASTVSAEGKDVLAGLMPDVKNTINGSGKYLMYAAESVAASIAYIKSRSIVALGGIAVLAIFLNFVLGMF